jgi:hypothetical protein
MKVRAGHSHIYAKAEVLRGKHTDNRGVIHRHVAVSTRRYVNNTGI